MTSYHLKFFQREFLCDKSRPDGHPPKWRLLSGNLGLTPSFISFFLHPLGVVGHPPSFNWLKLRIGQKPKKIRAA